MASQVAKGITITFRGDTAKFDESVSLVNRELKELKREYSEINKELKLSPTNLDLINKKQEALVKLMEKTREKSEMYKAGIEATQDKIDSLKKSQDNLTESVGGYKKLNEEQLKQFNATELEIEQLTNALHNEQKAYEATEKSLLSYSNQLQNFKGKQISSYFKETSEKANLLSQSVGEVARQTAILSAGAVAGLGAMVKSAGDFEQQWLAVQKVLKPQGSENNTKSWDQILGEIKLMASTLPVSIDTIMQTFANSAQLGIANDNLQEFVETMLRLDSATNITADDASVLTAQIYNIMGADISNVDNFANALVRLGNTSATTERDILEMASTLAGSATNVGFTEYQVLALADALASMGLKSASAGSSISTILTNIDKAVAKIKVDVKEAKMPIQDLRSVWSDLLGMSAVDFANAWSNDSSQVFVDIIGALRNVKDISEETKKEYQDMFDAIDNGEDIAVNLNLAMDKLGISTIRQDRSIKALVNSYDLLKKQMVESEDAFYKGNDAVDESERAWSSFNSSIQTLKNNLKLLAVEFGNQILPVINPIVTAITKMVKNFAGTNKYVKAIVIVFMSLLAVLSPMLFFISGLIKAFGNINGLLAKLALKFTPFFEKTLIPFINTFKSAPIKTLISGLTSPIGLLIAGITALVACFIYCWNNMDGFKESMLGVWETIKSSFAPIINFLVEVLTNLWTIIKDNLAPIFESLIFLVGDLFKFFGAVVEVIVELVSAIWDELSPVIKFIADFLTATLNVALVVIKDTITGIVGAISSVISWATDAIKKLSELLGLKNKVEQGSTTHLSSSGIEHGGGGGNRTFGSGGLGINTSGLNFQSGGIGAIHLQTSINVNNNGTPINDSIVREWANTITDIVSENIGRRL